jgi:hypothetical protein
MARPVRIELAGGWCHVTARGNERRAVFRDERDRRRFLELLAEKVFGSRLTCHTFHGLLRGVVDRSHVSQPLFKVFDHCADPR